MGKKTKSITLKSVNCKKVNLEFHFTDIYRAAANEYFWSWILVRVHVR